MRSDHRRRLLEEPQRDCAPVHGNQKILEQSAGKSTVPDKDFKAQRQRARAAILELLGEFILSGENGEFGNSRFLCEKARCAGSIVRSVLLDLEVDEGLLKKHGRRATVYYEPTDRAREMFRARAAQVVGKE